MESTKAAAIITPVFGKLGFAGSSAGEMMRASGSWNSLLSEVSLYRVRKVSKSARLATDFSISYDYGAEIYALASSLRTLQDPTLPLSSEDRETLKVKIAQALDVLMETYNRYFIEPGESDLSLIFSRSLSYVAYTHALLAPLGDEARHAEGVGRRGTEVCVKAR